MTAPTLWVAPTKTNRYPVYIGNNLLSKARLFRDYVKSKRVFIVSHSAIARHYLAPLKQALIQAGALQIHYCAVPAGERYKSLDQAERIWSLLIKHQYHRDSIMLALGGGMIGDLAGFTAGCYHRGIPFIQCPTSLIAQIDAAIGGKTAVNTAGIKNSIGLYHQPMAVMIDRETLHTLPKREYISGLAELIKYGLGFDNDFFDWIENHIHLLLRKDIKTIGIALIKACEIKAAVVRKDVNDQHERLKLNLGHTIGHALEAVNDQKLRHGEAVAIGLVVATRLSVLRRNISQIVLDRLIKLLTIAGLPTKLPANTSIKTVLSKIAFDKKHVFKQKRFVLLGRLGHAYVATDVTTSLLIQALES